jgi:predicted alpha/beta-hydrolase family hydrolase
VPDEMTPPLFLFAHGAGAPSSHPWMQRWAGRLAAVGTVFPFDYPYMRERRKRTDPLPVLVAAHREALMQVRKTHNGPVILIGKSMGGRVGCHLALEEQVAAVICLGYPLCGGGNPEKMRAEVLLKLATPILFVQGTRDSLCPLDLLEGVRQQMKAPNQLYVVDGGDHSLMVSKGQLKATSETQDDVDDRILRKIRDFVPGEGIADSQ